MKIRILIRADAKDPRKVTLETDTKYENRDTPTISYFGRKLVEAITHGAAGEVIEVEGDCTGADQSAQKGTNENR